MVTPSLRVLVDWDGDKVWDETDEDISTDVVQLTVESGVDLQSGHALANRAVVTVKNADHKYSPSNGSSALSPNVVPGKKLWVSLGYPHDDFVNALGINLPLEGESMSNDSNFTWEKINSSSRGFEKVAGASTVRAVVGSGDPAIFVVETYDADAYIGFLFQRNTDVDAGLVFRVVDKDNHVRVRFGNTTTVSENVVGGSISNIRSGIAISAGVNYWIEVELHGPALRLWITDLDAGSNERREIIDGLGTAQHQSATKHGLWHESSVQTDVWKDFGGWRSTFFGPIEEIKPRPGDKECDLVAVGDLGWMGQRQLYILFNGSNIRVDALIDFILTVAGFSTIQRELDNGTIIITSAPKAIWQNVRSALNACGDEEDGLVYQDGVGFFRLEESGHRAAGSHTSSRATFDDDKANAPYFKDLAWLDGSGLIENDVTFRYNNPPDQGSKTVWTLRDIPGIAAGVTRKFLARSLTYRVVDTLLGPTATTDYVGNAEAGGGGADMTSDMTVTHDTTNYEGKGTMISVENTHSTDELFVTLLQLRASKSYQAFEDTTYQAEDSTSQTQHEVRSKDIECLYIDNYPDALVMGDRRLARLKGLKTVVDLEMDGHGDFKNLLQVVHRVLGDRVTVLYSSMGINEAFFVEQMRLLYRPGKVDMNFLLRGV